MAQQRTSWLRTAASLGMLVPAAALAACGSSGSSTPASGASTPATATTAAKAASTASAGCTGYSGPGAQDFTLLPAPKIKNGATLNIGWLNPNGASPNLQQLQQAITQEASALHGSVISENAATSGTLQETQLGDVLERHVNSILVFPNEPQSMTVGFANAAAQKVPVVVMDTPTSLATQPLSNVATDVNQAYDYNVYCTMQQVAREMPNAQFAVLGSGIPVSVLSYEASLDRTWGSHFHLRSLGEIDSQNDTPADDATAAQEILTRYPTVQLIVTYDPSSAVAAAKVISDAGKSATVKVATPNGGESVENPAISSGQIIASYNVPWTTLGEQMVIAAYDIVTHQGQVPKTIAVKSNVNTP